MDPDHRRRLLIVWALTSRDPEDKKVVITQGVDREEAKRSAQPELRGNPDNYIVEPLTKPDDTVILKLNIEGTIG